MNLLKLYNLANKGFPKGLLTLWRSPEASPLVGVGQQCQQLKRNWHLPRKKIK